MARNLMLLVLSAVALTGCSSAGGGSGSATLPDSCQLPAGVRVQSISIDTASPIELAEGGEEAVSVTVRLNTEVSRAVVVCYEVKDSEIIRGEPLTVGIVPIGLNSRESTIPFGFGVRCDDSNEVAGFVNSTLRLLDPSSTEHERSSGERSTRIRVQEVRGIQTFAGLTLGTRGEKSDRIRVRCPR